MGGTYRAPKPLAQYGPDETDLSRLPQWAQKHIRQLTGELEQVKAQLQQFEGKEETNVFLRDHLDKKPLPRNANIYFQIEGRVDYEGYISCRLKDSTTLYIQAGRGIRIIPEAANSISIKLEG